MSATMVREVSEPTNGAQPAIDAEMPYVAHITIKGSADLLLHAWNVESVEAKGKAKKGSAEKKSDNLESYVRRDDNGLISLPTEYLRMSTVYAAKFKQDPRSPRKSAMDLYKAAVISLRPMAAIVNSAGLTTLNWDYEHKCRVTIQRAGITRTRPAFKEGWSAGFSLMVSLPQYIAPNDLLDTIGSAGRLVGVGDFRPTYGRFQVTNFEIQQD